MSIILNDNLRVSAPKPSEAKYLAADLKPWVTTDAAKAGIPAGERHVGLTVFVADQVRGPAEWCWEDGVNDFDLVLKSTSKHHINTKEVWVASRLDGRAGRGTLLDPYDWSNPIVSLADLLKWSTARVPMTINLMEGTYLIAPCIAAANTYWQIWSGLTFKGAGIDRTFIRPSNTATGTAGLPGANIMFGTRFTAPPPGAANANERIVRARFSDFTIDGLMDPAQLFDDRTWSAFDMDGDTIDISRVRVTRLGGTMQGAVPIRIFHTPTADQAARECGILIDQCEIIDIPHTAALGCAGIVINGGDTSGSAGGQQIRNKFALVSRCRLVNAGSLVAGRMRNALFSGCHVDPKGKYNCVNVVSGPCYNIRFNDCTFVNGLDQFHHSGVAVVGGSSLCEVGFHNCYFHSAGIANLKQASVKLQGYAQVTLTDCTHEPATTGNIQDGTQSADWSGALFINPDAGPGIITLPNINGNNLYCSGNRMYDGRTLGISLGDTPPHTLGVAAWDKRGFMLNQLLVAVMAEGGSVNTSPTLLFQEVAFRGPGTAGVAVGTMSLFLPAPADASSGMRRVITMPPGFSVTNLHVKFLGTQTLIETITMAAGTRVEYIYSDGTWKQYAASGGSGGGSSGGGTTGDVIVPASKKLQLDAGSSAIFNQTAWNFSLESSDALISQLGPLNSFTTTEGSGSYTLANVRDEMLTVTAFDSSLGVLLILMPAVSLPGQKKWLKVDIDVAEVQVRNNDDTDTIRLGPMKAREVWAFVFTDSLWRVDGTNVTFNYLTHGTTVDFQPSSNEEFRVFISSGTGFRVNLPYGPDCFSGQRKWLTVNNDLTTVNVYQKTSNLLVASGRMIPGEIWEFACANGVWTKVVTAAGSNAFTGSNTFGQLTTIQTFNGSALFQNGYAATGTGQYVSATFNLDAASRNSLLGQLGSGIAANKYLRGDGTWQVTGGAISDSVTVPSGKTLTLADGSTATLNNQIWNFSFESLQALALKLVAPYVHSESMLGYPNYPFISIRDEELTISAIDPAADYPILLMPPEGESVPGQRKWLKTAVDLNEVQVMNSNDSDTIRHGALRVGEVWEFEFKNGAWIIADDTARAPIDLQTTAIPVILHAANTMSHKVIECAHEESVNIMVGDTALYGIKVGDVWEVCQIGNGELFVDTFTTSDEPVMLVFPPGGGPRSAGLWSTMTIRCREAASSGVVLLVTGGVP